MSRGLDLASTIGTWVGAGIGIIALIGIVGPALIWYASTRERQKTLNAIGRNNNNYLSRGVHLGPNIWLGQRVRAPMLKSPASLEALDTLPTLELEKMKTDPTDTTWILFGSLLEAYGFPFQRGDQLVVRQGRAVLPVHPTWIFIIGLLGRYSDRRWQSTNSTRRAPRFELTRSRPFRASRNSTRSQRPRDRERSRPPSPTDWGTNSDRDVRFEAVDHNIPTAGAEGEVFNLYGVTGAVEMRATMPLPKETSYWSAAFETYAPRESEIEAMSPRDMFLLAFGFVKTSQSHYISVSYVCAAHNEEEADNAGVPAAMHDAPGFDPTPRGPIEEYYRAPARRDRARDWPSVYRMRMIELGPDVHRLGRPLLGSGREINTLCLMRLGDDQIADILRPLEARTKVPADSEWVRIAARSNIGWRAVVEDVYIERIAAQRLAYGLLTLPWHWAGYLVDRHDRSGGVGMAMFEAAIYTLPQFVYHLATAMEQLMPSTQQHKATLIAALRGFHSSAMQAGGTRSYRTASALQNVLADLGGQGGRAYIDSIVGILTITNSEFRELVHDSLRSLREMTLTPAVWLEMPSATLKVPKAFGVMQHFFVNWQEMFPERVYNHEVISVTYTAMVLAAARALVKCEMLLSCPDARPLIDAVLEVDDIVYMT